MKALHNSALSKLESWVVRIDCVTALTKRGVTLTKGTMWRQRHESASAGAPLRVEGGCTCAAECTALPAPEDFLLGNRIKISPSPSYYWEIRLSRAATRDEMHLIEQCRGPLYSAFTQLEAQCIICFCCLDTV